MGNQGIGKKLEANLPQTSEGSRILVLLNNQDAAELAVDALKAFKHHLEFVSTLGEFIKVLPTIKPDLVMLSWNLHDVNIVALYNLLTSLRIQCVVFGEQSDDETIAGLVESGILHTLLPPLTEDLLKEKLELLLWQKEEAPKEVVRHGEVIFLRGTPIDWGAVVFILKNDHQRLGNVNFRKEETVEMGVTDSQDEFESVDIEKKLILETTLPFDVFLNMPKNDKFILYFKKGKVFRKDDLKRLMSFGVHRVFIKKP